MLVFCDDDYVEGQGWPRPPGTTLLQKGACADLVATSDIYKRRQSMMLDPPSARLGEAMPPYDEPALNAKIRSHGVVLQTIKNHVGVSAAYSLPREAARTPARGSACGSSLDVRTCYEQCVPWELLKPSPTTTTHTATPTQPSHAAQGQTSVYERNLHGATRIGHMHALISDNTRQLGTHDARQPVPVLNGREDAFEVRVTAALGQSDTSEIILRLLVLPLLLLLPLSANVLDICCTCPCF